MWTSDWIVVATTLSIYIAVVISPGPGFAVITRLALHNGAASAYGGVFGLAAASLAYAILTMTGLAIIITQVGWLATAIQIGGGCYLIYLGVGAWRTSGTAAPASRPDLPNNRVGAMRGFRTAVLVNLSNPKGIAFFLGLYAVAIPPGSPLWVKLAILGGGFLSEIVWYGLVAALLSHNAVRGLSARFSTFLERLTGTVMIVFGLKILADRS